MNIGQTKQRSLGMDPSVKAHAPTKIKWKLCSVQISSAMCCFSVQSGLITIPPFFLFFYFLKITRFENVPLCNTAKWMYWT